MAQYHIYHSTGDNAFTEVEDQPREYAGYVEADGLEQAYQLSQNGDQPWNPTNPCRSTSVGDIIQSDDAFHMVCGVGFRTLEIPDETDMQLHYVDEQE